MRPAYQPALEIVAKTQSGDPTVRELAAIIERDRIEAKIEAITEALDEIEQKFKVLSKRGIATGRAWPEVRDELRSELLRLLDEPAGGEGWRDHWSRDGKARV